MQLKDIPRHAEDAFAKLCSASGITCTPPRHDEKGWAFFLEFPRQELTGIPLDMAPPSKKCLVQIKSCVGSLKPIRMKLSNAFELAQTDLPAFVLQFVYNRDADEAVAIYVLHFWEEQISRTLRRVRALEAKGDTKLQRSDITFPLPADAKVEPRDVVPLIARQLRMQGTSYANVKQKVRRTVGFDEVYATGKIQFKEGVSVDDIIDMTIGLRDRVDVSAFAANILRFGIPRKWIDCCNGSVQMRSHPVACSLRVSSTRTGKEVEITSQIFFSAIPDLPIEKQKARLTNPFINIVFTMGDSNITYSSKWNWEQPYPLDELAIMYKLLEIYASGYIHFQILAEDRPVLGADGPSEPLEIPNLLKVFARFAELLSSNVSAQHIPKGFIVKPTDLVPLAREIGEFVEFSTAPDINGRLKLKWRGQGYSGPGLMICYTAVALPGAVVYAICRRAMSVGAGADGEGYATTGALQSTVYRIMLGSLEDTLPVIDREVDALARGTPETLVLTMHAPLRNGTMHFELPLQA